MTKPDWTVIWNGREFEPLPLVQASLHLRPMHKHHAEHLATKLNADRATVDVIARFGREDVA